MFMGKSVVRSKALFGVIATLAVAVMLQAASAFAGDTVYYYSSDTVHSEVVVTDQNRNVVERTYYAPYGAVLNRDLRDGPGFGGHQEDPETGLVYMQQRYYCPECGRFLSVDPVGVDSTSGGNFNRYEYANDNPYRYTDPDGRCVDGLTCGPMVQSYAADEMAHPDRPLTPVDKAILVTGGAAVAVVGGAEVGAVGVVRAAVRYVGAKIAGTAIRQAEKNAPSLSKVKVRSDVALHGGRSGQNVKDLVGPPNAAVKGGVSVHSLRTRKDKSYWTSPRIASSRLRQAKVLDRNASLRRKS